MAASKISPDDLDGLEKVGMRFDWRACLIATGESLTNEDLQAMVNRRLLTGGKRAWVMEHLVSWPQPRPGDDRAETLIELQDLYESDASVREAFALADSQRAWEKEVANPRTASTSLASLQSECL